MKEYGIIGFPLTYSFSKKYFTEKIEKEGIADAVYHSFPLTCIEDLPVLLKSNPLLRGLSVTIPYKEKVLKYLDQLSDEVSEIGATNCIKISGNKLKGFNTDIIGFERSFLRFLKPEHTKALILGSGGASKAVQYVLKKLGIGFFVVSRSGSDKINFIQYKQISSALVDEYKIIINCTPLGMSPDEGSCPEFPYGLLTPDHYLYDLVYQPAKTLFLQKGEDRGTLTCNGYEMLVIQAEENWKIWNEE